MKKKTLSELKKLFKDNKIVFDLKPNSEIEISYDLDKKTVKRLLKSEYNYAPTKDETCLKNFEKLLRKMWDELDIKFLPEEGDYNEE